MAIAVARTQTATAQAKARRKVEEEQAERKPPGSEKVDMRVDPLELDVGYGLIRLVDPKQGGDLLDRITMIRRQMAADYGLVVPPVRIRDNVQLDANSYQIKIRGTRVATGQAVPDQYLAMDSGATGGAIDGVRTIEPAFGLPAYWITGPQRQKAEMLGYTVVDAPTVVATHLSEVIRRHAHELLSREETQNLITQLKETSPTVVEELIPDKLNVGDVQKALQNLLQESVSIRNLAVILETLSDYASQTKDPDILTEYVRNSLARTICAGLADPDTVGTIHVVTIDQKVEETINSGIEHTERGSYLTLAPNVIRKINAAILKEVEKLSGAGHLPVLLVSPQIRRNVKRMTEAEIPNLTVLSFNEIVQDMKVESHGMVVDE